MIISHKHRFIFLKTKKTAGTSIEIALSKLCGPDDVITPVSEADEKLRAGGTGAQNWRQHGWWQSPRPLLKRRLFKTAAKDYGFYNHMPAAEAKALIGDDELWQSYFKFAFDRNPWDRQVSYYHYCFRDKSKRVPFEQFMELDRRARLNNYEIYSIDGEPAVDFIGRYESLDTDLSRVLKRIDVSQVPELPRAKGGIRPKERSYQDYYTPQLKRQVGDWYHREIALLGYDF